MTTRLVRLARPDEVDDVQAIFNHAKNAPYLGGFTMREPILSKIEAGATAVVVEDDVIIAADEVGRKEYNKLMLQLVGVSEDHKKTKCATALYTFWSLQCALEGRYLMVDSIISDNPIMPFFLPKMGFEPAVTMRSKVRRHHAMTHWDGDPAVSIPSGLKRLSGLHSWPHGIEFELNFNQNKRRNFQSSVDQLRQSGYGEKADLVSYLSQDVEGQFL